MPHGERSPSARRPQLAVIGPGEGATGEECRDAEAIGGLAAREGWTLVTGGRASGVMDAASRGARQAGGLAIGILGDDHGRDASPWLDVAVLTGLGEARDAIVARSADVVVACGISAGTLAEIGFTLKAGKPLVLLRPLAELRALAQRLDPETRVAATPEEAMRLARELQPRGR